jgi:hypothetical protein
MPRIIDTEENTRLFFCFETAYELLKLNQMKKELDTA